MKTEQKELPTRENEILDHEAERFPDVVGMTTERFAEVIEIVTDGYKGNLRSEELQLWFDKLSKKELAIACQFLNAKLNERRGGSGRMNKLLMAALVGSILDDCDEEDED